MSNPKDDPVVVLADKAPGKTDAKKENRRDEEMLFTPVCE
jgi:hypothetical protein